MCWSSGGYWETLGGTVLLHTVTWGWYPPPPLTIPILFSPQSKCLAHCPMAFLPCGWADARLEQWGAGCPWAFPPKKHPIKAHITQHGGRLAWEPRRLLGTSLRV